MSRFLYYLIFINMLAIITTPVPRILLLKSQDGAIVSMILSIVIGTVFTYVVVKFFIQFPGSDFIDLLTAYTPPWIRISVTIFFIVLWYVAGLITLVMTAFLLITFLTPAMSIYTIALSILITVFFGVLLKSKSVLFTLEIALILLVPIGFIMFIKLYGNKGLSWVQVSLSIMHIQSIPHYSTITASTFTFMGCANLIVYNKYFKEHQILSKGALVAISAFGTFMLASSFFIPIGFNGFDQVDQFIFPWTSAADSVRMNFGLVERVVFVFMFLFVTISFISIIIHWHVAYKLLLSLGRLRFLQFKQQNFTPLFISLTFLVIGLYLTGWLTQYELYHYAQYFYNLLPIFVVVLFGLMIAIKRGASS